MYNHIDKKPPLHLFCPICRQDYDTSQTRPAPTCGHPSCIRAARERGLPFTTPPAILPETTKNVRKRKTGKSNK